MKKAICNSQKQSMQNKIIILLLTIFTLASCEKKTINGSVDDNFNRPLSNVTVQVKNSQFQTTTDKNGDYSLDYAPGNITILYSAPGYTDSAVTLNITEKQKYPAQRVTLCKKPLGDEVYFSDFVQNNYTELSKGKLTRNSQNFPFSWEGPLSETYYLVHGNYTSLAHVDTTGTWAIQFVTSRNKKFVLYQVRDWLDNAIVTRTDYWGRDPVLKGTRIKCETTQHQNVTLYETNYLKRGKYAFAGAGEGIGSFSTSVTEPIYLFEIK